MNIWGVALYLLVFCSIQAQQKVLLGRVLGAEEEPLQGVHITSAQGKRFATLTDSLGYFQLSVPSNGQQDTLYLSISFLGYVPLLDTLQLSSLSSNLQRRYQLQTSVFDAETVVVVAEARKWEPPSAAHIELEVEQLKNLPAISSDISHVLGLLPGVVSNRSLSNTYSVRGGNYQENLFYIEDMPIYLPYLARSGQQEGLNLANVALTRSLTFAAGGWQAQYGDKLSSILNVHYKDPKRTSFGAEISMVGGEAYFLTKHKRYPWRLLVGARYKDTRYFLRNLDTKGEYFPRFYDMQAMLRIGLSDVPNRSELSLFAAYSNNNYRLRPSTRTSTFGTDQRQLRFSIDFQGEQALLHDITHAGITWTYHFAPSSYVKLLSIQAFSDEQDHIDLLSTFRLCDVLSTPDQGSDHCQIEVGKGMNFEYARNFLQGTFSFTQASAEFRVHEQHILQAGAFYQYDNVSERVNEYTFSSVSDQIFPISQLQQMAHLRRALFGGFLQHRLYSLKRNWWLTTGIRAVNASNEVLLSPRVQFSFFLPKNAAWLYKFSAGLYPQLPFYREYRGENSELQPNRRAQRSIHFLAGLEYAFRVQKKDFTLYLDAYYKQLYHLIPYEQSDIRLHYYGDRSSEGYAYGLDARLYGFFVPGQESWISISYLRTEENIANDGHNYVRRPTDQRISTSLFLRDYVPRHPTWQVYAKMLFGTGMPFNPAGEPHYRNVFEGEPYYQLDMGFSKVFIFSKKVEENPQIATPSRLLIVAEVFNLLGSSQNISYTWVGLPGTGKFAVPSNFSAQFINLKVSFSM